MLLASLLSGLEVRVEVLPERGEIFAGGECPDAGRIGVGSLYGQSDKAKGVRLVREPGLVGVLA
ncbi:MAG: hypothetical protein LAO22_11140 [Acidobacteriia bacterium]|nr:hypothetical protein [Terriglobia bacterium]